jgi:Flp pilus assembly protein TadG
MVSIFKRWFKDRSGAGAVEFALIAPLLGLVMVAAADIAHITFERSDMLGAVRSGSQYFMAGGTNTERATTIVETSWSNMPQNAVVAVNRICECGGVTASCNLLCPDQSVPIAYAVIEIEADVDGIFVDYYSRASDKVRVR